MPDLVVPLLIDCHVHFREPGLTHKANMISEGTAAFHGGIGLVCEMPNTNPPTQTIAALRDKVDRSLGIQEKCDVRFFFGATDTSHLDELRCLWTDPVHADLKKKCCGLKLYLDNSTGDLMADTVVVARAFALCGELDIPLVAHCEHSHTNNEAAQLHPNNSVEAHSLRRPVESEMESVREAIKFAEDTKAPLHIAHISTKEALKLVKAAKSRGVRVTCEVCPHHLFIATDDYATLESKIKVNPPIRSSVEHEPLWEGILDGTIDCIASDHAPHLLREKDLGASAPSGMPGVETTLPLLLSVSAGHWPHPGTSMPNALRRTAHGTASPFTLHHIRRLMFDAPNTIFRLNAPTALRLHLSTEGSHVIRNEDMHYLCGWTPYDGWLVRGEFKRLDEALPG